EAGHGLQVVFMQRQLDLCRVVFGDGARVETKPLQRGNEIGLMRGERPAFGHLEGLGNRVEPHLRRPRRLDSVGPARRELLPLRDRCGELFCPLRNRALIARRRDQSSVRCSNRLRGGLPVRSVAALWIEQAIELNPRLATFGPARNRSSLIARRCLIPLRLRHLIITKRGVVLLKRHIGALAADERTDPGGFEGGSLKGLALRAARRIELGSCERLIDGGLKRCPTRLCRCRRRPGQRKRSIFLRISLVREELRGVVIEGLKRLADIGKTGQLPIEAQLENAVRIHPRYGWHLTQGGKISASAGLKRRDAS